MSLLLLPSVHFVMKAESLLRQAGLAIEIIPTPREISSDCGVTIKIADALLSAAEAILTAKNLSYRSMPNVF